MWIIQCQIAFLTPKEGLYKRYIGDNFFIEHYSVKHTIYTKGWNSNNLKNLSIFLSMTMFNDKNRNEEINNDFNGHVVLYDNIKIGNTYYNYFDNLVRDEILDWLKCNPNSKIECYLHDEGKEYVSDYFFYFSKESSEDNPEPNFSENTLVLKRLASLSYKEFIEETNYIDNN